MSDVRLRRFMVEVDEIIQEYEYYDEETETDVCNTTEQEVYDRAFRECKDFRFVGKEKAQEIIHIFMTDFGERMKMLSILNK